jgi:hypothetical protein
MMKMTKLTALCAVGYVLLATQTPLLAAQECNSRSALPANGERFTSHSNGTVTDKQTQLMWKQCMEGQRGARCLGQAAVLPWDRALQTAYTASQVNFAGHSDWRLPTVEELLSLVDKQCREPAINLRFFPATPASSLWSGNQSDPNAWSVDFSAGHPFQSFKAGGKYVRLVRNLH